MPSTRPKKTHYDYRISICFFCCRKGDRILNPSHIDYIKTNILPNFDLQKDFLPLGTCGTCRGNVSLLTSQNPNKRRVTLPTDNDYAAIIEELSSLPRLT